MKPQTFFPALLLILSLSLAAQAVDKLTPLHSLDPFTGQGTGPTGNLFMDKSGNLYGGGTDGDIFELSPNGSGGWNYSVLYTCNYDVSCAYSLGSLVMDSAGNLYGSTFFGFILEYSPGASGAWTASTVHGFSGGTDGTISSPVVLDAAGNLYGENSSGGASGLGYLFEISPASGGGWSLSHLHDFSGIDGAASSGAAAGEVSPLLIGPNGYMYGTTFAGGSDNYGVVFALHQNDGAWHEVVLHSFTGEDGANPAAQLTLDASGNLYGTTTAGGANNFGAVFETSQSGDSWQTRTVYSFHGAPNDGGYANAAVLVDPSGNLFSTTSSGGTSENCATANDSGCGIAFELTPKDGKWKETLLHDFQGFGDGGAAGGIVADSNFNLYGATLYGGNYNAGVIYELTAQGK